MKYFAIWKRYSGLYCSHKIVRNKDSVGYIKTNEQEMPVLTRVLRTTRSNYPAWYQTAKISSLDVTVRGSLVPSTDGTISSSYTLQQKMDIVISLLISEGFSRQTGGKQVKLSTSSTENKSDGEPVGKLLELLKTTQQRVNLLENEFEKVESENLHQD